jgi:glycosyltransferase involved in cell wall biosynthesis
MRILSIGNDIKLFDPQSAVAKRVREYGELSSHLTIIVLTTQKIDSIQLSPKVDVHATRSFSRFLSPFDAFRIARRLHTSFDLVTTQDPFDSGFTGLRIARFFGVPLQVQVHTDIFNPFFEKELPLQKVRVALARYVLPKADCVRVVSMRVLHAIEDAKVKLKESCVSILPIWVDVERVVRTSVTEDLHKKYPQFEQIVLMASRFTKEKDLPLAIKGIGELRKKYPHLGMVIVGEGGEQKLLQDLVIKENIGEAVIFEPWRSELVTYYKSADLFAVTSLYEGYGMTLVEAAAAGCPLVTSDVGCVGELLSRDKVRSFEPGNLEGFVAVLDETLADLPRAKTVARTLQSAVLRLPSHQKYLERYRESWELCMPESSL